jgi:hypothetical protein
MTSSINKRNIFISSRMKELAIDRAVAFSTCVNLDFRPLMFETEPKDHLKTKIDNMLLASTNFLGIYYETVGNRERELYYMTPIEYELVFFVRKECEHSKTDKCPFYKDSDKGEENCLKNLRRIIIAHHNIEKLPYHICHNVFESLKFKPNAEIKLLLFCKLFQDERGMTPQLGFLLSGMARLGFVHDDFENQYDLSNLLIDKFSKEKLPKVSPPHPKRYYLELHVKDEPGQSKELSSYAFQNNLNLDDLIITESDTISNHAIFYAKLTDYSPVRQKNSDKLIEDFKSHIITAPIPKSEPFHKSISKSKKKLFNIIDNQFYLKQITDDDNVKFKNAFIEFKLYDESSPLQKGKYLIIRIYHLDVPGIFNNICKVFAGDKHYKSNFYFSILRCIMYKNNNYPYFPKSIESSKSIMYYQSELNEYLQVTEILLGLTKSKPDDSKHTDIDLFNKQIILKLENSLLGIIGVKRVIISENIKFDK